MPRGKTKKELDEISKNTRFNSRTAVEAGKKSAEKRKYLGEARKALKDYMDDDKLEEIMKALYSRGKAGSLTAIDMIFKYTDPVKDEDSGEKGEGGGVAMMPQKLPKNESPEDSDE